MPKSLDFFSYEVNNGITYEGWTITLKNDIDLFGHNWEPIGHWNGVNLEYNNENLFRGTFDGDNHTISNMNINIESITNGNKAVGFFSVLLNGCVKNLKFENSNVEVGNSSNSIAAGTVAGAFAGSEASNINIKNSVISAKGSSTNVGGLCGSLYSSTSLSYNSNISNIIVSNITLSANTNDWKYRGGMIGYINEFNSVINNCY